MGYNTVAFMINDLFSSLQNSPKAAVWGLTHPPAHLDDKAHDIWLHTINEVARENNEPAVHCQSLEAVTFHADFIQYFMAGMNSFTALKVLEYGKTKDGKRTVTLELPED